jgi:hypothetical protein
MADYRIYRLQHGHIIGPSKFVTCDTEEEAVEMARQLVDRCDIELWQEARCICGFSHGNADS